MWDDEDPPTNIPSDVGFKVGEEYPHIVVQIHYARPFTVPNYAGVKLSVSDRRQVM